MYVRCMSYANSSHPSLHIFLYVSTDLSRSYARGTQVGTRTSYIGIKLCNTGNQERERKLNEPTQAPSSFSI